MSEQPQILDMATLLAKAKTFVERKAPDHEYRQSFLRVFSKTIQLTHSLNPDCWSINFGSAGPFLLIEHVWVLDTRCASKELAFHIYLAKLDETVRNQLEKDAKINADKSDLWSTITIRLPDQENLIEKIWPAFEAYVKDKARSDLHPLSISPHLKKGAGLVEYIRVNGIDPELPQPGYVKNLSKTNGKKQPNESGLTMNINLSDLVSSFAANDLSFTPWQVATFYTALQTKGFVILSGISGTGKTKLAQAFARLLPQPAIKVELPKDLIRIVVQPYMLKYNRMIIPRAGVEFFTPIDPGQSIQVKLEFEDKSEECKLKHYFYKDTDYIQLLLKGKARAWFEENFLVDSTVILEPSIDGDDNLLGFRLGKPEYFTKRVPIESNEDPDNYLFLSVRPDWRDSKSLFGYYNPIDQEYHSTPFLEFIKRAHDSYQRKENLAWFVLLDEMNLARVEYYFSDLLSVMESGRDENGWSREPIRLDYPMGIETSEYQRELKLPPNLYFIGTVNVDETTHAFSPKVLDRAFTLELTEADFSNYPIRNDGSLGKMSADQSVSLLHGFTRGGHYAQIDKTNIADYLLRTPDLRSRLGNLNAILQPFDLHFGYRVLDEITAFLANAESSGFYDELFEEDDPFDAAILMKVLPKFHGSRTKLEDPLKEVLAWCIDPLEPNIKRIDEITQNGSETIKNIIQGLNEQTYQYPHTARRVIRMLRSLYTTGFASFG